MGGVAKSLLGGLMGPFEREAAFEENTAVVSGGFGRVGGADQGSYQFMASVLDESFLMRWCSLLLAL